MQINIGTFNKKIEILEYIIKKDKDGFPLKTEQSILKTWAEVKNISGTEIQKSNADFAQVKTKFLIRTPKVELKNEMIIKFLNNIYEIIYINDYGYNKKYTEIMTKKISR